MHAEPMSQAEVSVPVGAGWHVWPFEGAQASQESWQSVAQHTPSMEQLPLAQPITPLPHAAPSGASQTWLALQTSGAGQPLWGAELPTATLPHVPVEHCWHVPEQAVSQQWPSAEQVPWSQSLADAQVAPGVPLQLPDPSHTSLPLQVFVALLSCEPAGIGQHSPIQPGTLHAIQVPVQPLLQQTPSVQKPVAH